MEFLQTVLVFILVLGVLVTVHELGHFLAARLTGMRAETFAVGMGNRVAGYNRITGFSFGSLSDEDEQRIAEAGYTDYRIAAFPIGGYVKIAGMIDESMDDAYTHHEPQPWEFRSKNAFQKLFVMTAGVLMNILLALLIFSILAYVEGKTVVSTTTIGYLEKKGVLESSGLREGDVIRSINGEQPQSWNDIFPMLVMRHVGEQRTIIVERAENGVRISKPIVIEDKVLADAMAAQRNVLAEALPAGTSILLSAVEATRPASKAGLQAGDTLLTVNSVKIISPMQLIEIVRANVGKPLMLEWNRGGTRMSASVTPDSTGKIGVMPTPVVTGTQRQRYGLFEALAQGYHDMIAAAQLQIAGIVHLVTGKTSMKQSVGGPIMIAKISRQAADAGLSPLLKLTAVLSVMLAIMNILPFPALDGGHVVFILIESVIRREVPVKVKMAVQQVGVVMLLCFMVFVFYNDLTR
jgi:regulator of sigma E protease